jgi:hypothetical protein
MAPALPVFAGKPQCQSVKPYGQQLGLLRSPSGASPLSQGHYYQIL